MSTAGTEGNQSQTVPRHSEPHHNELRHRAIGLPQVLFQSITVPGLA
jgi:hypothetical protein